MRLEILPYVRTDHEATDTRAEVAEDESEGPV
jgi:hypothetical protein